MTIRFAELTGMWVEMANGDGDNAKITPSSGYSPDRRLAVELVGPFFFGQQTAPERGNIPLGIVDAKRKIVETPARLLTGKVTIVW
jgi:hypothetical protein